MQALQMGDYDYGSYALHRTGVAPFGNGPFYNSLPLWSYKPTMTSSPASSVIMASAFAAPRRQAMSEVGTTREGGLHRSDTVMTARSMPHESDNSQSVAWYQKTKQAFTAIPAMFEARANKGNKPDIDRYNRWQPQDIESNPTTQYLSLPAKPVAVFEAKRSQATPASVPDQSAFSKPHSVDGLNQRYNPSAAASSALASPARHNPSAPVSTAAVSTALASSESATSARYNPSAPASSAFASSALPSSESATSARYNPSAATSSALTSSARHDPPASASSASVSTANRPSADDRSANGQATNSRVLLKATPTSNKPAVNTAQASSNYATPRFMAELPPPVRGNVQTTRPAAESSLPRPVADPSFAPISGIYSKHTGAQSHPSENALGHRPHVDTSSVKIPPHNNFSSSSHESISKDYSAEPSGKVKFNPLFESHTKDRGELKDLSSAFAMSSGAEVGLNRHLAGQRIPTDGVRDGNRLAAKVNAKSASAVDEKQVVKDAFQFLDDFDD